MAEYKLSYTAAQIDGKLKKIDTLAAKSEIPTATSDLTNDSGFITEAPQADWNQTDETALDFIKNKPDEEDALALLAEVGFVEPVADADGSIYTDENGNIYTLI